MKPHDAMHPYVLRFIGCGHGVLFSQPCVDCELVSLHDQYNRAVKTIFKIQGRLKELGDRSAATYQNQLNPRWGQNEPRIDSSD